MAERILSFIEATPTELFSPHLISIFEPYRNAIKIDELDKTPMEHHDAITAMVMCCKVHIS